MLTSAEPVQSLEPLLARARQGDADAFCDLASTFETSLYRQALAMCRNETDAEDLVSETMIEAWKSIQRFNGTCRFSTWLYAILLHRYKKFVRSAGCRPVPLSSLPIQTVADSQSLLAATPDAKPGPSGDAAATERSRTLLDALRELPEIHQQVLLMRFFQGASLSETAAALELPVGTVKSRLHHALEKLREMRAVVNLFEEKMDT